MSGLTLIFSLPSYKICTVLFDSISPLFPTALIRQTLHSGLKHTMSVSNEEFIGNY